MRTATWRRCYQSLQEIFEARAFCGGSRNFCYGFLGASLDGVVCSGERMIKLIEVKCPYRARQGTVREICSNTAFCCSLCCSLDSNQQPRLKDTRVLLPNSRSDGDNKNSCVWLRLDTKWIYSRNHYLMKKLERKMLSLSKKIYFDLVLPEIIYLKYPEDPCDYSS